MENGVVNLVAIVSFLILSIGIIPMVMVLGTPKGADAESPKMQG